MSTVLALIGWLVAIQLARWISKESKKPVYPTVYRQPAQKPIPRITMGPSYPINKKDIAVQLDQYLGSVPWDDIHIPGSKRLPKLEYFCTNFGATLKPSPAEQLIIDELVRYPILWEREISFPGLRLSTGGWGRFDFFLVDYNVVIEYNSKKYHDLPRRAEVDKIKQAFCSSNGIRYIAYTSADYYHFPQRIATLMSSLKVSPTYRFL